MATPRLCSIPNCGKLAVCREWCDPHYRRWLRNGDPLAGRISVGERMRYYQEVVLTYEGDDCLIWPYSTGRGYALMYVNGREQGVCRFLCEHVNGLPPTPDYEAAHSCGKGKSGCVTKRHLSWKTSVDNHADRVIHGTHLRGTNSPLAKLTEENVRVIRSLHQGKEPRKAIARRFKVSEATIKSVLSRHNWAWLD